MMKEVDKTIEEICEIIQKNLKKPGNVYYDSALSDMVKALAELVSARAQLN